MARIRRHLTYSNVMVTILAFIVLTGGTAVALDGSNTVFSDDIVDDQVFSADVRNDTLSGGGLTAADLAPNSIGNTEITDGQVATADVRNDTLSGGGLFGSDLNPNSVGASEIAAGAVDSGEIAQSAVDADEISDGIHSHEGTPVAVPGGGTPQNGAYDTDDAVANCAAGEELISGGATWQTFAVDAELWIQKIEFDHAAERVTVWGGNDSGTTRNLVAIANCLET